MRWNFLEVTDPAGPYRVVTGRDGRSYVRYPVGFPHRVVLRERSGRLTDPAQLRLMKSVSLALSRIWGRQGEPGAAEDGARIIVEVSADETSSAKGVSTTNGSAGYHVKVGPRWLEAHSTSALALEAALEKVLSNRDPRPSPPARLHAPSLTSGAPKVLLFRQMFSEHYQQADAVHLNPGMHFLATALRREGATVLFCDGKLPYHDPAGPMPRRDVAMRPDEFLTDPDELEQLLAAHADLDLVALTVIEFCYNHLRHLIRFIRERSDAWIALGGTWPTAAPLHAFANLPEANFLVRGDGDQLIGPLARVAHRGRESDDAESAVMDGLGAYPGILARWPGQMASLAIDRINLLEDLDRTELDFTLLSQRDVHRGMSLSLSRGCSYGCHFCTVMNNRRWRAVSPRKVDAWLAAYVSRLQELYGSVADAPPEARDIQLWDDDFFIDPERAMAIVDLFVVYDLRINYVQGTVASFFVRSGPAAGHVVHHRLLDRLADASASRHLRSILIGTESYSEAELRRVGKRASYPMIRTLARELARRRIRQSHLMILANRDTRLDDLLDSLLRLVELRRFAGRTLYLNDPCWLLELYTTPLYRARVIEGTSAEIGDLGVARCEGHPEFDYPFLLPQRPRHDEVFEIVRRFPRSQHYGIGGDPAERFEGIYGAEDDDYTLVLRYVAAYLTRRIGELDANGSGANAERQRLARALRRLDRFAAASPEGGCGSATAGGPPRRLS